MALSRGILQAANINWPTLTPGKFARMSGTRLVGVDIAIADVAGLQDALDGAGGGSSISNGGGSVSVNGSGGIALTPAAGQGVSISEGAINIASFHAFAANNRGIRVGSRLMLQLYDDIAFFASESSGGTVLGYNGKSVGVGTTNMAAMLHVKNYVAAQSALRVDMALGQTANAFEVRDSDNVLKAAIDASGNLSAAGATFSNDIEATTAAKGLILTDRTTTTRYRLKVDSGVLSIEAA
jgi:hypothetical protein